MLLLEISKDNLGQNAQNILPLLNQFPEFFIIVTDEFPTSPPEYRKEFGLWSNEIISAKLRKQIILHAEIPTFLPLHNYIRFIDNPVLEFELELLKLKSYLFFENIDLFFDEIAFILQQYGEIYITDTRLEIQSQRNVVQFRSAELERKFVYFQKKINDRISPHPWMITLFLKHSIQPCRPPVSGPLSHCNWTFKKGNNLPHDRFWADKQKRIFISSSVGLEFKEDHKPIIYRLSSLIRSRRSQIVSFS